MQNDNVLPEAKCIRYIGYKLQLIINTTFMVNKHKMINCIGLVLSRSIQFIIPLFFQITFFTIQDCLNSAN